jgi:hypothetical protein
MICNDIFLVICLTLDNEPAGPKRAADIKKVNKGKTK